MNTQQIFDPYDIGKTEIESVPVYYKNTPWATCIYIYITLNTGAFDDPLGKEGVSHFLEHMIFDGSPNIPDKKAVREWGKQYTLNTWNAYTSHYETTYHLKTLPEHFNTALSGMFEQIFSPLLKDEDVEHERKVITQEAWGCYKNEKFLAYVKEYSNQIFPGHSLSRVSSPLGWPETIKDISADDIRNWHKKHYHIGNMHIVIGGLIDDSHIQALEKYITESPKGLCVKRVKENMPSPMVNTITKKADDIGMIQEQVQITRSTNREKPSFPMQHGKLFKALLYDILHEKLRDEKSLCYGVSVDISRSFDYGGSEISIKTSEEHIDTVLEIIKKEIQSITMTDEYAERFEQIKKTNIDQVRSSEVLTGEIVKNTSKDIVLNNTLKTLAEDLVMRKETNFKDVQNAGLYYTDEKHTVTEVILPSNK